MSYETELTRKKVVETLEISLKENQETVFTKDTVIKSNKKNLLELTKSFKDCKKNSSTQNSVR